MDVKITAFVSKKRKRTLAFVRFRGQGASVKQKSVSLFINIHDVMMVINRFSTECRKKFRDCFVVFHLEIFVTHGSLNVIHLPTRLPWENTFLVPNPAYRICCMWSCHSKGCQKPPDVEATPC